MEQLDGPAETIFVDDGSTDCSPIILQSTLLETDPRYRYIGLSRNFGHQVAITAGMDAAAGRASSSWTPICKTLPSGRRDDRKMEGRL